MKVSILLAMISYSCAYGATYLPIDIEQQLKESNGVVHGYYSHKSYKKDRNGQVITEHVFTVIKSAGMTNSQMINRNDFKVMVPGGKWQGVTYKVSGTPRFTKGEEVILLLAKKPGGYALTNLALGKYSVIKEDGKEFISSAVFPNHKRLGKIEMIDFEVLVRGAVGESFEKVYKDTYVHKGDRSKRDGRKPASLIEDESKEKGINPFWFIIVLALLGVYTTIAFRDRSHDDR